MVRKIILTKEDRLRLSGGKTFSFIPEMKRLMQANNPAHLDFVKVRVYTIVPVKPSTAQKTPMEDMIWVSSIKWLGSPDKKNVFVMYHVLSKLFSVIHVYERWLLERIIRNRIHYSCQMQFRMSYLVNVFSNHCKKNSLLDLLVQLKQSYFDFTTCETKGNIRPMLGSLYQNVKHVDCNKEVRN